MSGSVSRINSLLVLVFQLDSLTIKNLKYHQTFNSNLKVSTVSKNYIYYYLPVILVIKLPSHISNI